MKPEIKEGLQKWRESGAEKKSRLEKFVEKPTRKLAIELMCIQCMGGEEESGYRNHIKNCTSPKCPLYEFRPFK